MIAVAVRPNASGEYISSARAGAVGGGGDELARLQPQALERVRALVSDRAEDQRDVGHHIPPCRHARGCRDCLSRAPTHHQAISYITRPVSLVMYGQGW